MSRSVDHRCFCTKTAAWVTLAFGLLPLSGGCACFSSHSKPALPPTPPVSSAVFPAQPLPEQSMTQSLPSSAHSFRPPAFQVASQTISTETANASKLQPDNVVTVSRPVSPESTIVKREILPPKTDPAPAVVFEQPTIVEKSNVEKPNTEEVAALKRRISELEKTIEEKAKAEQPNIEDVFLAAKPVAPQPISKPPRRVPTFNDPGVTVSSDAERIRIEVTDKTLFVPGTRKLNPEAEDLLRKIAGEIRAGDPDASLEIEGHTDCINTDPANSTQKHDIASAKAMAVMEYFVKSLSWKEEKIRSTSFGAGKPVADNGSPEGRTRNNRVEIVVLPQN